MSLEEWKKALQCLGSRGREESKLEETVSTLKRLVRLSLDIKNRSELSLCFGHVVSIATPTILINRECVGEEDIGTIASLLDSFDPSDLSSETTTQLGVWLETLKLLRNLCAELPSNQTHIMQVHNSQICLYEFILNCSQKPWWSVAQGRKTGRELWGDSWPNSTLHRSPTTHGQPLRGSKVRPGGSVGGLLPRGVQVRERPANEPPIRPLPTLGRMWNIMWLFFYF